VILANTQLEAAQKAVKTAQANLDLSYVRSPQNGQIIKIHTWPGELVNDKGIVDIGNTQQMYVNAEIYETDINKVKLGQIATIKGDGIVEELTGIVDEIGLEISSKNVLGTDPVADADARVVEVKIKLNPQDSIKVSRLTNLQVNVIINPGKPNNY
ncbi:MAG: efflux RND transporter periplasmic adaptor subunit, partial [Dolichospermum sp.]